MGGFAIASILFGMICGNLGAVIFRPLNLGLFWNTLLGGLGAAIAIEAQNHVQIGFAGIWYFDLMTAGLAGILLYLLAGLLMAFFYRS